MLMIIHLISKTKIIFYMKNIYLVIAISALLAGINSYYGVLSDWIAVPVIVILFYLYIEMILCDWEWWQIYKNCGCAWMFVLVVSIVAIPMSYCPSFAWLKPFAIMMFVSSFNMFIGATTYNGYYK